MFPQPIPKYVQDHPTYASWFDERFKLFTGPEDSEWLQIAIQDGETQLTLTDTPVLPYPEALSWPLGVEVPRMKKIYVTFYYYRLIDQRLSLSGNIRMKLFWPKDESHIVKIEDITRPYKEQIHRLRSRSYIRITRVRSSKVRGLTSSRPLRPNEQDKAPFLDYVEKQDENGSYSVLTNLVSDRIVYQRLWSGVRTPNFGALAMKGQLPVNGHSVSMFRETGGQVVYSETSPSRPQYYVFQTWHMSKHFALPGFPGHLTGKSDKAFARLAKKVGTIEANLAQDLVQYKQTVRMITDNVNRIRMAYKATRVGNFSEALKLLYHPAQDKYARGKNPSKSESTASNWLMIQYGWKPLLNDIHESVQLISELNRRGNGPNGVLRVTSSATEHSDSTTPFFATGEAPRQGGTRFTQVRTTTRFTLEYRQASRLTTFLQQTGFTNPLNLAWEVLPYSFVLDWLLPIGPWLETLSLWQGKEFVSGSKTVFTKAMQSVIVSYAPNLPDSLNVSMCSGSWSRDDVALVRTALTSFPNRELPSFKNPLSVTHALNALALLRVGFAAGSKIRS